MMNMLNKVTTQPRKLALGSIVSYRGCITDGTAKALAAIVLGWLIWDWQTICCREMIWCRNQWYIASSVDYGYANVSTWDWKGKVAGSDFWEFGFEGFYFFEDLFGFFFFFFGMLWFFCVLRSSLSFSNKTLLFIKWLNILLVRMIWQLYFLSHVFLFVLQMVPML